MQEVRFEDYESRREQIRRFYQSEQEREKEGMPALVKAGSGIAAAAGLLAVGHRAGVFRRIARFLDVEGRATKQAFKEVFDSQGSWFRGEDRLTASRIKELKDSFVKSRKEMIEELNKQYNQKNILSSRKFRMQEELERRARIIGETKRYGEYTGEIAYNIQEGYRFEAIMDEMSKTEVMKNIPDGMSKLRAALERGDLGVLDWGSKQKIVSLLSTEGLNTKDVVETLEEVRSKYKGHNFSPRKDEAYRLIEGMQEKLRHKTAELIPNATKRNNKFKEFIIGHRQATIQDILDLNEAGKIKINADLKAMIDEVLSRNKDFAQAVFDENLYISTKNGELFDYHAYKRLGRRTAEWWANTLPGGLLHLRDILNIKAAREQASMKIFQRGTILSSLNGHMGLEANAPLHEEVLFMYGKFVRVNDVNAVNNNAALEILNKGRDMYLTSSQFGSLGKMHRQMSGILTDNETPRNRFAEFFDLGRHDRDSVFTQGVSIFTKFFNEDWDRNKINRFIRKGLEDIDDYLELNSYFKYNTRGYTPRVLNNLKDLMPRQIREFIEKEDISFSRDEDILKLFDYIGKAETKYQGRLDFGPDSKVLGPRVGSVHEDLQRLYRQYERNPELVLNRKTPIGESNPILGDYTRIFTGMDEIKQQLSLYLTHEIMESQAKATSYNVVMDMAGVFRQNLKDLFARGKIKVDDLQQAEELLNYAMFRSQSSDIYKARDSTLISISNLFQKNADFQDSMRKMVRRTNPLWERYSSRRPPNQVGDMYLAINKSDIGGLFNRMFGLNSTMRERYEAGRDLLTQLSPFTGRGNMEDVTTLNLFGVYYPIYRLQDALGDIGLGFSDASMSSAFSIFNNLIWKRFFPIYTGVEVYKYVDWKLDQMTGEGIDERWENYKANERLERAASRTEEEIYEAIKQRQLRPGIEHWEAMPEIYVPGFGPFGMGDVLNTIFGTFLGGPVTLREEDLMTYDETLHDLYYGVEEVRNSRWWFMGSKTAYRGDRIIEFRPNSFRLAHSDYEWTNTNATGEEYFAHHILPNPENPLGMLAFVFGTRDPYWWEKKHYYDRPYMLTGELFNPNTMLLGDIGNATIGRLIKPVKEMHPEYWADPVLVYEEETGHLGERPMRPVRTEVSPAGRVTHEVLATPSDYGATSGSYVRVVDDEGEEIVVVHPERHLVGSTGRYIVTAELNDDGEETGGYVATDLATNQTIYVPAGVSGDMSVQEAFQYAETESPEGSEVKAVTVATYNPSYQAQISTQPRAMFDEEFPYRQEIMYRKMRGVHDPRDISWRIQEGIENWTEPLGVYKWIVGDELLGYDPYTGEMVIQRADAAYNLSNRFWETNIGSLGGQLSEIGRRFIRRDSSQLDHYNPIRNTMPDWLPGDNYFINFQVGDPYSKIPHGERRLPGEAYEALNELHPDEFGRYGAFDRFKILADVAPWSDEYKFWSEYLLENLEDEELRKEAAEIRRQVSKRKQKYDFQPYRFKHNDVVYYEVTVDRFLDDYTFLTEEFGDQPIRIAGVQYRKKAEGVLESYFQEGDTIVIGIAADPTQRIAKDTYGTMRAVIFNELGNINRDIIEKGLMVENMNDFSAPGVHARFTPKEIQQGARWETIAHASSPLNTKFLQVRTAVEEYERDQIYGKDWATWDNFLLEDYLIPYMQGLGRFENPLWSMTAGGALGLVLGRFLLKGGRPTKIAAYFGALYGLGANLYYKWYENKTGEVWIPERRRIEHEINEYFDILKFLKYEGLYQKAREEIIHETGYDIEDFVELIEQKKEETKKRRKELEEEKKWLYINQPEGWEERRKEINKELEEISMNKDYYYLPEAFLQALYYREERDTTLYAVDPHDDLMKVARAFPYKDRWFFMEFVEAPERERERILELVPENQRRIYKAIWGYEEEPKKPLEYYMEKYNIPDWTWEGWRPEYSLEDIKVKVVQEHGLDLSDFNFWPDNVEASKYVPDLTPEGNQFRREEEIDSFEGFEALRQNLIQILQGQGLYDVRVAVQPSTGHESHVYINYTEDRSQEIEEHLRLYGERYV